MKRTKKAEANHKREEFLKAAMLHCHTAFSYATKSDDASYLKKTQTYNDMLAKYQELGES